MVSWAEAKLPQTELVAGQFKVGNSEYQKEKLGERLPAAKTGVQFMVIGN
jgi:hypothetical protein